MRARRAPSATAAAGAQASTSSSSTGGCRGARPAERRGAVADSGGEQQRGGGRHRRLVGVGRAPRRAAGCGAAAAAAATTGGRRTILFIGDSLVTGWAAIPTRATLRCRAPSPSLWAARRRTSRGRRSARRAATSTRCTASCCRASRRRRGGGARSASRRRRRRRLRPQRLQEHVPGRDEDRTFRAALSDFVAAIQNAGIECAVVLRAPRLYPSWRRGRSSPSSRSSPGCGTSRSGRSPPRTPRRASRAACARRCSDLLRRRRGRRDPRVVGGARYWAEDVTEQRGTDLGRAHRRVDHAAARAPNLDRRVAGAQAARRAGVD